MNGGQLVLAYHGCDESIRDLLVSGELAHLDPSSNRYDWLGEGVYFFENDPKRAMLFAEAASENPKKKFTAKPIVTPAIVGVVLRVNRWLDMTMQAGIADFQTAYAALADDRLQNGRRMPTNKSADIDDIDVILHHLDKAVFDTLHAARVDQKLLPYDAVKGAFPQGAEVAPSSAFKIRSHIQIALRNNKCVVGWFLVPGFY